MENQAPTNLAPTNLAREFSAAKNQNEEAASCTSSNTIEKKQEGASKASKPNVTPPGIKQQDNGRYVSGMPKRLH